MGYPLSGLDGEPPWQDRMGYPSPRETEQQSQYAGGMPLAFTQEDFLVNLKVLSILRTKVWGNKYSHIVVLASFCAIIFPSCNQLIHPNATFTQLVSMTSKSNELFLNCNILITNAKPSIYVTLCNTTIMCRQYGRSRSRFAAVKLNLLTMIYPSQKKY